MGPAKGVSKPVGSGRKPGSLNKKTKEVQDTLARLNCDPIAVLAYLATNNKKELKSTKNVPLDLRLWAAKELAQYVAPKLCAIALQADIKQETIMRAVIETPSRLPPGSWDEAALQSRPQ
jgi:hypothetical protein